MSFDILKLPQKQLQREIVSYFQILGAYIVIGVTFKYKIICETIYIMAY